MEDCKYVIHYRHHYKEPPSHIGSMIRLHFGPCSTPFLRGSKRRPSASGCVSRHPSSPFQSFWRFTPSVWDSSRASTWRSICGCSGLPREFHSQNSGVLWPFLWLGLWLNVLSGIALLAAYPTKALTNPIFYIKLGLIAFALAILRSVRRLGLDDGTTEAIPRLRSAKALAITSILCWAGAITSGRFLAYTYIRLMVDSTPVPRPWMP